MKVGAEHVQKLSGLEWPLAEIARQLCSAIRCLLLAGCPVVGGVAKLSGIFFVELPVLHHISQNAFTLMAPTCTSLVIVRCSADVSFPPAGSATGELTGPTGRVSGILMNSD